MVDRYLKRERFVSQGFWTIEMEIKHDNGQMHVHGMAIGRLSCICTVADCCLDACVLVPSAVAKFRWTRDRLYDRLCCALLFESCFEAGQCTIADIQNKQTIKRSARRGAS